jgi:hypothetical protein
LPVGAPGPRRRCRQVGATAARGSTPASTSAAESGVRARVASVRSVALGDLPGPEQSEGIGEPVGQVPGGRHPGLHGRGRSRSTMAPESIDQANVRGPDWWWTRRVRNEGWSRVTQRHPRSRRPGPMGTGHDLGHGQTAHQTTADHAEHPLSGLTMKHPEVLAAVRPVSSERASGDASECDRCGEQAAGRWI